MQLKHFTASRCHRLARSVTNRKLTERYTAVLIKLITKAKLEEGIKNAMDRLASATKDSHEYNHFIVKMKKYETVMNQLMICAERKCIKKRHAYHTWSIVFKTQGKIMRYWNQRLRASKDVDHQGSTIQRPPKYNPPLATTYDEVQKEHCTALIEWIKTKDASGELHRQYVLDLVEHIAGTSG